MNKANLSHKEKQLALSSLLRRDRNDPGAAELLTQMMRDEDFTIRKRAISIADRFLDHPCIHKTLLQIASGSSGRSMLRERCLDQLEPLLDPNSPSVSTTDCDDQLLYRIKRRVVELVRDPAEDEGLRGKALRLSAYFLSSDALKKWIMLFHNRTRKSSRLSAISAMGRSGDPRWRNYIQGFLESDSMEFTCAALEAIAELDYRPEEMIAKDKDTYSDTPDTFQETPGIGN